MVPGNDFFCQEVVQGVPTGITFSILDTNYLTLTATHSALLINKHQVKIFKPTNVLKSFEVTWVSKVSYLLYIYL